MTKDDFLRANRTRISNKTPYEQRYVDEVLVRVPGLRWDAVQAQTPFVDADGTRRFIDFTIVEGDVVKIAIEVDGYDKTGRGHGMTRAEFADWSRREQAIAAAGYRVIRVANGLVDRAPEECARTVELVLKRERALAHVIARLPVAHRPDLGAAQELYAEELLNNQERAELKQLAESHKKAMSELEERLQEEIERRQAAETAHNRADRDRRGMLAIGLCFATVAAAAAAITFVATGGDDRSAAATGGKACSGAAPWADAVRLRGSRATVVGQVAATSYQSRTRGRPTFIDVGKPYPANDRLVVVVWGADRKTFPEAPDQLYWGKSIAVTGEIETFRGLSQIKVSQPSQIVVC